MGTTRITDVDGVIVINEEMISATFDVVLGINHSFNHPTPPFRRTFSGCITHVETHPVLVDTWIHRSIPPDALFTVVGEVGNHETGFGKITCHDCFFTGGDDLQISGDGDVSCKLQFDVINPNEDVEFKFLMMPKQEQS